MVTWLTKFAWIVGVDTSLSVTIRWTWDAALVSRGSRRRSYNPPIITLLSLHLAIYCLGCIAIAVHDFMASMEREDTQYRYSVHFYIKGDINCFSERMYSMRILRDNTCRTRDKTQARFMNFASRRKGYIS